MDISAIFQTWRNVLTKPGELVFEEERTKPEATLTTALIWIVGAAIVAAVLGLLRGLIFVNSGFMDQMISQMKLPPEAAQQVNTLLSRGAMGGMMGGASLASIIFTPLGFLIGAGILHLIATLLGGRGNFGNYTYLLASFQAPIALINAVLSFVPVVGVCLTGILSIYSIVLTYFATKVEYNLTSGKAIAVVLIPVLFVILLLACVVFGMIGMIMSLNNR
jgi:hypothetical protein